jgi:hypothetical protein
MLRSVLVVLAGVIVFLIVLAGLQGLMGRVFPLPAGVDVNDPESLGRAVMAMPTAAFLALLGAYAAASLAGGAIAARLANRAPVGHALAVGVLATAAGVANFAAISHPAWVVAIGLPLFPGMTWLGGRLGAPR